MNKRVKLKLDKGLFWYHKGQMLWKYHSYQNPDTRKNNEVMLCYDPELGCELYFKNWKSAKHYLRRVKVKRKPLWEGYNFTADDIPF